MRKKAQMLTRLAKLAEIRSDLELKRFAAFRRHVDTLAAQQNEQRIDALFRCKRPHY